MTAFNPLSAKGSDLFYYQVKSPLLGIKRVFKHQDLQIFGLKLNK